MIDLAAPQKYAVAAEYAQWPKCHRCSVALDRPYPVELFIVMGREPSRLADGKYELVLEVGCTHGEARRVELERLRNWDARRLWGIAGGLLGGVFQDKDKQRIRIEIPRRWAGLELEEGGYQASATEQLACSRVYAFAPATRGRWGVLYMPGSTSRRHGLETQVR